MKEPDRHAITRWWIDSRMNQLRSRHSIRQNRSFKGESDKLLWKNAQKKAEKNLGLTLDSLLINRNKPQRKKPLVTFLEWWPMKVTYRTTSCHHWKTDKIIRIDQSIIYLLSDHQMTLALVLCNYPSASSCRVRENCVFPRNPRHIRRAKQLRS